MMLQKGNLVRRMIYEQHTSIRGKDTIIVLQERNYLVGGAEVIDVQQTPFQKTWYRPGCTTALQKYPGYLGWGDPGGGISHFSDFDLL